MSFDIKRLYELLPAVYRIRDTEYAISNLSPAERAALENLPGYPDELVEGPLKALLTLIAKQVADIEENMEQLYDDQFIETCADWVVPYIGNLVGTRGLLSVPGAKFSRRAEVANTIGYRRRKGTASVIEQLARDVTMWNANVVEYFLLLATTQYLNHIRKQNLSTPSIRDEDTLEYINTPFDKTARTADVRRIAKQRGKYNIPNIGIFLWRLNAYPLTTSPAYRVDELRYKFDPLSKDTLLYNNPITEETITHLAEPVNVPMPISRRVFLKNLEQYYGSGKSVLIYANDNAVLPAENSSEKLDDLISICNLSDVTDGAGTVTGWAHMPANKIAIDPVLGRIAFPSSKPSPANVHVTFHYGFSTEMGGGEYGRDDSFSTPTNNTVEIFAGGGTIQNALNNCNDEVNVIELKDNEYNFESLVIKAGSGQTIELRAADKSRALLIPAGEIRIEGEANSTVILNGLLIGGGRIFIPQENPSQVLQLKHCTLLPVSCPAFDTIPAQPSMERLVVAASDTRIEVDKTITGGLRINEGAEVIITNSIIDAVAETAVAYSGLPDTTAGGVLSIYNTTVIGKVHTRIMKLASNTIFLAGAVKSTAWPAPVMAQRLQEGCVRFSYIPPGSKLPRPYQCQPSTPEIAVRVRPVFTSLQYGDAGYCQLAQQCATEITEGADDQAEMGAFHDLYQPQRVANLRTRLDEYLRFGLEAGIFYAS